MSLDALRSLQEQECGCQPHESACPRCVDLADLAEDHLLPIAEALETMHATALLTDTPGHDCAKNLSYPPCKALKALQGALDCAKHERVKA